METLVLENLTVGYRHGGQAREVLRGIRHAFAPGTLTCLLGPNGVGKSTLLKTVAGFLPPLAGGVTILGKPVGDYTQRQLSLVVSVVLTGRSDVRNLTVDELVALGRSPHTGFWGRLCDADRHVVARAMRIVGVGQLAGRMVQTLSDGEMQKVMIAKALAQQTPIILLDEPTAFLDFGSKVETMRLLAGLAHREGKTIILSTHDLQLAARFADSLLQASGGSLLPVEKAGVEAEIKKLLA